MNDSNQPWWEKAFGPGPEPGATRKSNSGGGAAGTGDELAVDRRLERFRSEVEAGGREFRLVRRKPSEVIVRTRVAGQVWEQFVVTVDEVRPRFPPRSAAPLWRLNTVSVFVGIVGAVLIGVSYGVASLGSGGGGSLTTEQSIVYWTWLAVFVVVIPVSRSLRARRRDEGELASRTRYPPSVD